jgi:hypothetical protein
MPGLDPGIHHLRLNLFKMDCGVKPGNDGRTAHCCIAARAFLIPCHA